MARAPKNNVDYFPFYCEEGKKMFYIEETYGNEGFAVFVKILRELARTDYHYLDLSNKATKMFMSAKLKVSMEVMDSIILDLVELGKFNKELWDEYSIIWCQDFIDSIQDAYTKRNNKCITFEGLLHLLEGLGVRKSSKGGSKGGRNTQIKEEYSKEENIKEENDTASPKNYILVWIEKHCPTLCKMKKPMTNAEAETLEKKFNTTEGLQLLRDTLLAMENKPTITKDYASTYLTCVNWMKRDNRYQSNKTETKIQRWKDPSEVYMCTDWIKRIPKPPNLNDDEACMDFIITWNIRELRKYQYEQTGTTNQIADYEE